jgi:hypothetical protein
MTRLQWLRSIAGILQAYWGNPRSNSVRRADFQVQIKNRYCTEGFYLMGYNARLVRWKSTDVSQENVASIFSYLHPASLLLGSFVDPEGGDKMLFRNVGCLSTDYTALYPRRWPLVWEPQIQRILYVPNIRSNDALYLYSRGSILHGLNRVQGTTYRGFP